MTGNSIMQDGVAALAAAAAVLIEDARPGLLLLAAKPGKQATAVQALGADLASLGAAAAVLAQHEMSSRSEPAD